MDSSFSDFFESTSFGGSSERLRRSTPVLPWLGPPQRTLSGVVPLECTLAQNEKVAVCLVCLKAYPSGFEVDMAIVSGDENADIQSVPFGSRRFRAATGGEVPPEMLRFGVQFADGAKAANTQFTAHPGGDEPSVPVILERGGSGGDGRWDQSYWIWPLPPPWADCVRL